MSGGLLNIISRLLNYLSFLEISRKGCINMERTLSSVAKEIYITKNVLERRIEDGYYSIGIEDIIIRTKNNRNYKYLSDETAELIIQKAVNEALELKKRFEKQGWRFEYDEIDQIENGYWLDENTPKPGLNGDGSIPLITYTPYIYPNSSESPVEVIEESLDSVDDLWLYVAHAIKKTRSV